MWHLPFLAAFSFSSNSSPRPIAANILICSSLSRIWPKPAGKQQLSSIFQILWRLSNSIVVETAEILNVSQIQSIVSQRHLSHGPGLKDIQVSCCFLKARIFGKSRRQPTEHNLFSSKSRAQIVLAIVLNDNHLSNGRYQPIRGYSRSCYTDTGSLKKCLQALAPSSLPRPSTFFPCSPAARRTDPLTEGLEQATRKLAPWSNNRNLPRKGWPCSSRRSASGNKWVLSDQFQSCANWNYLEMFKDIEKLWISVLSWFRD